MAVTVTHQKVSAIADSGDTSVVQPSDWNASHTLAGLGTGVETALGVNVGSAGAVVVNGGALGTPSSGTLTNATGLPIVAGTTGTLSVARGGTGATDAATARTNLGLAIGTDVQAYDAQLADFAGLAPTKGRIAVADGTNWTALAVGTNTHVLTADSAEVTGVKWAAASGGGATAPLTLASGTITASSPALTITQEWNNASVAFTAMLISITDTADDTFSRLLDFKVDGTTVMYFQNRADPGPGLAIGTDLRVGIYKYSNNLMLGSRNAHMIVSDFGADDGFFRCVNSGGFAWSSGANASDSADLKLNRDAADTLAQRRGTNAQVSRIYNTYTDASNYERLKLGWNANAFEIKPEAAGTGTTRVIHISGLPTANPGPGILWNNAGTPAIGT